ncbi:MAG: S1C family serine protease [Planctomycetota bacterium]
MFIQDWKKFLCLIMVTVIIGYCSADTIVLKDGKSVTGDILADKDSKIFVDIGITVLTIPKDEILEYEYSKASDERDQAVDLPDEEIIQTQASTGHLYRTATLKETTIEKAVERFSEAVVKVTSPVGTGSGFFINEEGYLITNYHVIERETKIEITMFLKTEDGFEKKIFKKVKIEAFNPFVDLALLKVEDLGDIKPTFAYLGDIGKIQVGQKVFAIGNPLGLERTVTNGVISTTNRAFEGLVYLQTNADINPGNSGGPLFNMSGEVIGVTNMGYVFFGGLGFAIPINYVKDFMDNRESFIFDKDNPNTGYKYLQPDRRRDFSNPDFLKKKTNK